MGAVALSEPFAPQHGNRDCEAGLLGHVLTTPGTLDEVAGLCSAEDFTREIHAAIFTAAQALQARGIEITPHTVRANLVNGVSERDPWDEIRALAAYVPVHSRPRDFARLVGDLGQRRRLDAQLEAARSRLLTYDRPIGDCISELMAVTAEALEREARERGHKSIGDAADEMMRNLERAMNGKAVPSIQSGLRELDGILGGFMAGDSAIIAGRPGHGKSLLLGGIALNVALRGRPVVIFSAEMTRQAYLQRLSCALDYVLSNCAKNIEQAIPYTKLRRGSGLTNHQFNRIYAAQAALRKLPLHIYEAAGMTVHQLAAIGRQVARKEGGLGLFVTDYLQLVSPGSRYQGNRVQEVGEISVALKHTAMDTGWVSLAGCQLNRNIEMRQEKRPQLSDLRESGNLEQDGDQIIGIFREAENVRRDKPASGPSDPGYGEWRTRYEACKEDLEATVLKNRSGPVDVVKLFVDLDSGAILDRVSLAPEYEGSVQ